MLSPDGEGHGEDHWDYKDILQHKLDACKKNWTCVKCGRYCPNCAGRSCVNCCLMAKEGSDGLHFTPPELKHFKPGGGPTNASSIFRMQQAPELHGSFQCEYQGGPRCRLGFDPLVNYSQLRPDELPPWDYDQPRYRPNPNIPYNFVSPQQKKMLEQEDCRQDKRYNYAQEVPPISHQLTEPYRSCHPDYVLPY